MRSRVRKKQKAYSFSASSQCKWLFLTGFGVCCAGVSTECPCTLLLFIIDTSFLNVLLFGIYSKDK